MKRLGATVAVTLVLACSQVVTDSPLVPPDALPEGEAAMATRSLFRVRYQGPEGAGRLRLVMRQVEADRFQLQAADSFGRSVWSLDLDGEEVLLIDHRRQEACVAGSELRVPELALRPLPLPAVARVLGSKTPLPAPPGVDATDWIDGTERRWTARWDGGGLAAWTMWQSGLPQLWWSRDEDGGVLSHRDGSQFRWRQVARETFPAASYRRVEAPAEYRRGSCRLEDESS